jgi:alpha-methylacyl-CoA racemase
MSDQRARPPGPLAGVRIVDLSRLAPGPYATMLLADMGAEVVAVTGGPASPTIPAFQRGKYAITLDLKSDAGRRMLQTLATNADAFVEGFRPGVAKRLGASYETLSAANPRLVYCSLTGYGQDGPRAQEAGHDINYLAVSGVLGALGPPAGNPTPPLNLLADFAAGSLVAAFSILAALLEARTTGKGRTIDAAMIDGCLSLMAMHLPMWKTPYFPARGDGLLAGSRPFYRTYACADGKFVAVGALERPFFDALWRKLELGETPDHMASAEWPGIEAKLSAAFASRARDDWAEFFAGSDACVTPVLAPDEAWDDLQVAHRHSQADRKTAPAIPRFDPPSDAGPPDYSERRCGELLRSMGLSDEEISAASPRLAKPPDADWSL